ncbi:hypothetical protein [Actinoplanes subtropicus]|uniref:hypothetical protein n=1 Tax=Actinoplanes subtropicus TaxID=543632 RepID=UPI0004C34D8F|nr:hypothetical protein [Actinoplanes subtropicus]
MVNAKISPAEPGREMLLVRYTWTATGDVLSLAQARAERGKDILPWTRPGWFWVGATPASAARIRAEGHRAVGTAVTTWMPPQTAPTIIDVPEPEDDHRPWSPHEHA